MKALVLALLLVAAVAVKADWDDDSGEARGLPSFRSARSFFYSGYDNDDDDDDDHRTVQYRSQPSFRSTRPFIYSGYDNEDDDDDDDYRTVQYQYTGPSQPSFRSTAAGSLSYSFDDDDDDDDDDFRSYVFRNPQPQQAVAAVQAGPTQQVVAAPVSSGVASYKYNPVVTSYSAPVVAAAPSFRTYSTSSQGAAASVASNFLPTYYTGASSFVPSFYTAGTYVQPQSTVYTYVSSPQVRTVPTFYTGNTGMTYYRYDDDDDDD